MDHGLVGGVKMQQHRPTNLSDQILYADNHLLAINKPGGMLTQASGQHEFNLEDWAREWVQIEKKKTGAAFLHAVHRLDRPVSGVVLFARTSKALRRLNESIRNARSGKIYHAWVEGVPEHQTGTCSDYLIHANHRAEFSTERTPDAKKAVLHYRVLKSTSDQALLEVELITGRYHQIRVQLSGLGCPIKGDSRYGAKKGANTIGLHHKQLIIEHPIQHEELSINAPLPVEMRWD
jgi:23S rRNA pseudouridine1911/1915/1917 synthase